MASNVNELDQLRTFLTEAIRKADPALDVDPGSPMDTEVITPVVERLGPDPYDTPVLDFIRGRLNSQYPDLVLQDGEPLDDYAVKIMRVLLEPYRRQIERITRNQSLASPDTLTDTEADNLAANFFVARRLGGYATGIARLYFTSAQPQLVTPANAVYSADGLRFLPVDNQAITAEVMRVNTEGSYYYFDVVCRAENQGASYNIEANMLVGVEGMEQVVKVSNTSSFVGGVDYEETEPFLARVESSLAERSLVTARGIAARLLDVFSSIRSLQVIGHGDPEMQRDILTGSVYTPYGLVMNLSANGWPTYKNRIYMNNLYISGEGGIFTPGDYVQVGDRIEVFNLVGTWTHEITRVLGANVFEISAAATSTTELGGSGILTREEGDISISDIPGGIVQPDTEYGTIDVVSGEVHIGGKLDVFLRAGFPQQRSTSLESIRDAEPLHFSLDLESFGDEDARIVSLTDYTATAWAEVNSAFWDTDQIAIEVSEAAGDRGWWPSQEDVGRYIQLLPDTGTTVGTFKITEVQERYGGSSYPGLVVITVSLANYDRPGVTETALGDGTYFYKIREEIEISNIVRDRDESRPITGTAYEAGVNFDFLGASVGDSVVIETGDDTGIYTIRRLLSYADENDTLLISQDLTKSVEGLRYRIADELDIDLVQPKTTKIPLGDIYLGDDLKTEAGSNTITGQDTTNFTIAGVAEGDIIEIKTGPSAGIYTVQSVSGSTAEVTPAPPSTSFNEEFEAYTEFDAVERPLVRVREVELLDASQQGTGITIPYGDIVDARVLSRVSDQNRSVLLERWDGTAPSVSVFRDTNVNFENWGVASGHRLSIKSGVNIGEYVIEAVDGSDITVAPLTEGGSGPLTVTSVATHYTVGQPSVGTIRLYFLSPTSVSIDTGQYGGRLKYVEGEVEKEYFFSEVEGRYLLPAAGSGDALPRGIRPVRQYTDVNDYTVFTLPDDVSDAYTLEVEEGDLLEVNEQIPWRTEGGTYPFLVPNAGDPGLLTLAGSDLVSVPGEDLPVGSQGSGIDFDQMEAKEGLVGQMLIIDENAPDAGIYTIEEVIDRRTLRLNTAMTTTTENSRGVGSEKGTLTDVGGTVYLSDITNNPVGFARVGDFVTIYEVLDPAHSTLAGTYEILSIDFANDRIEIDMQDSVVNDIAGVPSGGSVGGTNQFRWMTSDGDTNVFQQFFIYQSSPARGIVTAVAPLQQELTPSSDAVCALDVVPPWTKVVKMTPDPGTWPISGVKIGDIIEIPLGPNAGAYEIADIDIGGGFFLVYDEKPFSVVESAVPYRIWGGIHGSPRMIEVGPDPRDVGVLTNPGRIGRYDNDLDDSYGIGRMMPFAIRRREQFRTCSTDMAENFDGTLYYTDISVESVGNGAGYNLEEGTLLEVTSGMEVDGYTYQVENNVLTFSTYEEVSLKFDRRFLPEGNSDLPENLTEITARNLEISYDMSPTVRVVNDLLRSDTDRPINADPIARHMLPTYVFADINYQGGSSDSIVGQDMEDYINSMGPTEELEVSDLEAFATRRGATYIEHPIELVGVTHDLDRNLTVERSEDKIGGTDVPYNGTARISSFFAKLTEGLDVDRE